MLAEMKERFLAHQIRNQIESLARVKEEIEMEHVGGEALIWKLRTIEHQLRQIRGAV